MALLVHLVRLAMNLKGYVSVRLPVPVAVQNLVLRDYCAKKGHTYFLADVEYVMPDNYKMLHGLINYDFPGIVAYSMFMAPKHKWVILSVSKEVHFALENYVLPRDAEACRVAWKLKELA